MKRLTITSDFSVYKSTHELPEKVQELMGQAAQARSGSYAPYSRFQVGAALLLDNGEIICGSNQENASYPVGLCAERTAVFYAGANYPQAKMLTMCITVKSLEYSVERPAAPCGFCRQAIAEYENKQKTPIEIYFMGEMGEVMKSSSMADLLPLGFDKNYLLRL